MYHSVFFGDKNSWTDWHLIASSRPVINPPSPKRKTIDIPGGNGEIDLSTSLTGYPVYDNRKGSIDFIVVNDLYYQVTSHEEWYSIYSSLLAYLHGKKLKVILEDEPEYYYYGTLSVNDWSSNSQHSKVTIDYDLDPYKYREHSILSDWEWDELCFTPSSPDGIIPSNPLRGITISTSTKTITIPNTDFDGPMPICPMIDISTTSGLGAIVTMIDQTRQISVTKTLPEGGFRNPEFIFVGNTIELKVKAISGTGHISIDYQRGKL